MPACAPNYSNTGYSEYFDATLAAYTQYINWANACTQWYYGNGVGVHTDYSNACADGSNVNRHTRYGYSDSSQYFNATDDCNQYGKYANVVSYTKNAVHSGAYALGITESLVTGIDKISASVSAIQHLRDKLKVLIQTKGCQNSENPSTNLSNVEDVDFNDSNAATPEFILTQQYSDLKNKISNLAAALKASGTSNIGTLSAGTETPGSMAHKQDIVNLMNDMKAIAASCYQTYSNHQNYTNGYVNYSVNGCFNAAYGVYSRTDSCANYARFTCSSDYSNVAKWKECCDES